MRNQFLTQFTDAFAPTVWDLVQQFQIVDNENKQLHKVLKEALNQVLRKWTDRPPAMVSEKIKEIFEQEKLGSPFDLIPGKNDEVLGRNLKGNKKLVFDHVLPINEFIQILIDRCHTLDDIKLKLLTYPEICVITRDQDDMLNANHMKTKRLKYGGWKACYKAIGIKWK